MPGANNTQQNDPGDQPDNETPDNKGQVDPPNDGKDTNQPKDKDVAFKSLDEAQSYIKNLRAENAGHRNKNKELSSKVSSMEGTLSKLKSAFSNGEGDEVDPAEAAMTLASENEALLHDKALTDLAIENEIPPKQTKYFKFLLNEKIQELGEGEEVSEEQLAEIVEEVRTMDAKAKGKTKTGVNDGAGNKNASQSDDGDVSLDQFAKMSQSERSLLYAKNAPLYHKRFAEAKAARRL